MSGTVNDDKQGDGTPTFRRVSSLVVAFECDRPLAGGARQSLERVTRVTLGRGAERRATRVEGPSGVTLEVHLPAAAMSSTHARLLRAGGEWILEDEGSTNGSFVNGARVTRAVVGLGDVITVGRTLLLVSSHLAREDTPDEAEAGAAEGRGGHATLDPETSLVFSEVERVARSEISILARGETGTGKEVLARWVHHVSGRTGAFVGVNCGGIPPSLVESFFFGHMKGSFSGAVSSEPGAFRAAHEGTLFLDEIGDLPAAAQAALLRALQEREVVPVGGTRPIKVELRVLAATHKPLEAMIASGQFRGDLFARLAGFTARLPPLRARRMDLGVLVASVLRKLAGGADARFTPAAAEALFAYDWPHNTRQLEQCLSRALVLAGGETIGVAHLPSVLTSPKGAPVVAEASGLRDRDEKIRRELLDQLARHRGNLASVARAMGKARMQVHRWCQRFGIDPNAYRE